MQGDFGKPPRLGRDMEPPFDLGPEWGPGDGPHERRELDFGKEGPLKMRGGPRGRGERFGEGREIRLSPETQHLFSDLSTNGFYFQVWSIRGNSLKASTNVPAGLSRPSREKVGIRTLAETREIYREMAQYTDLGECLLVGRCMAADIAAWRRFGWLMAGLAAGVLALGLGVGWSLTTHALRPVAAISLTADRIAEGRLAERIAVAETESELGRLAGLLNLTFGKLESAFVRQKQFTADASHELRTPLAVIISAAQGTLARERTPAEYRETIETCLGAAQQMRRLAQSLLELARYDAGQETLERSPLDLAELAQECVEQVEPLARQRGLVLRCELGPAPILGDAGRLGQVATNLLANAIYYNREGGKIRVQTTLTDGQGVLIVSDTGTGIAPHDLPHVFERFYRADKSRGRAEGRTGLGLSICKAIVEAHGGAITVASTPGQGATFTVRLPTEPPG